MMRRPLALVLAGLLFAGCIQTERRYDVRVSAPGLAFLVDREAGCVWLMTLDRRFVSVPVEGRPGCVERGTGLKQSHLIDDAGIRVENQR